MMWGQSETIWLHVFVIVSQCSGIQAVGFASFMWKPLWLSPGRRSDQSHRSNCAANGCKRVAAAMKLSRAVKHGAEQVCSSKTVNINNPKLVTKKTPRTFLAMIYGWNILCQKNQVNFDRNILVLTGHGTAATLVSDHRTV